jgi:hypothetical protein
MATIGQPLVAPETGWKRFDDTNVNISYSQGVATLTSSSMYNGAHQYYKHADGTISFNFVGTKLRLIATLGMDKPDAAAINIDGQSYMLNQYSVSTVYQGLAYEKLNLSDTEHFVQIVTQSEKAISLDAIDIDATGTLRPYSHISSPTNLTASAGNSQVNLHWDVVTGATGYSVKRSTITGGPYTTLAANVTTNTYADYSVVNGVTYYYVVTAFKENVRSADSNGANAIPAQSGHGLLRITMTDSSEREYQLSNEKINNFIQWCDNETGSTRLYVFDKLYNLGEFQCQKEYLVFDKLISFEVMALKK